MMKTPDPELQMICVAWIESCSTNHGGRSLCQECLKTHDRKGLCQACMLACGAELCAVVERRKLEG